MRKLIVQQFVTVDGIVAEPDGGMSFMTGMPFAESDDERFKTEAMSFLDQIDSMILGANTYRMFVGYWPVATNEGAFGDRINQLTKYIASSTLSEAPWGDYENAILTNDVIAMVKELKQQDGKNIVLWGSLTLMRQLFTAELIDEVQLRICPATRGEGVRLFTETYDLELISTEAYERSVVVTKYRVLYK